MIEYVTSSLLHVLRIPHTKLFINNSAKNIPYKNSFYGIGLLLSRYNILANSVRFKEKSAITDAEAPCIVLYDGNFALLLDVTEDEAVLLTSEHKKIKVCRSEFETRWDGNALIPTVTKESKEPDYIINKKEAVKKVIVGYGLGIAAGAMIIIFLLQNRDATDWRWWNIFVVNLLGIAMSVLLLGKQLDIHNRLTEQICGWVKSGNCDNVTHSSGAEFLGLFKLSEIGFSFFATNVVLLVMSPKLIPILAIISYVVLPFSFWSVWYQKFKVKQWCVLCLGVLLAMWAQALLYVFSGIVQEYDVRLLPAVIVGFSYFLIYCATSLLMKLIAEKRQSEHWQYDFVNLKAQDKVIAAYMRDGERFDTAAESCSSLIFGEEDAPIEITIFSNPYCSPCAEMHKRVENIPGGIAKIRYVMTAFNEDLSRINLYIIAAYQQMGAEKAWEILSQWFQTGKSKGETFFNRYNLNVDSVDVLNEFNKQKEWRYKNTLRGTPTVIVNGRELVGPYVVEDFKLVGDAI